MTVMIEDLFPFQDSPKNNKEIFKEEDTPKHKNPNFGELMSGLWAKKTWL
jgi:hypothetical protein